MARIDKTPFEATIEEVTLDGQGVIRRDGKACFIHGALKGERVMAVQTGRKRRFDSAEVVEVLEAAPGRVEPPCEFFGLCGGCKLQHASIETQRAIKEQALFDALERIGHVTPEARFEPLTDTTLGYRRTARLGAKYVPKKGGVLVGFRERGSPYLAEMTHCEVLHPAVGQRIRDLRELIGGLEARDRLPQIEVAVDDDERVALIFRNLDPLSEADSARLSDWAEAEGIQVYLQPGGPETVEPLAGPIEPLVYRHPDYGVSVPFMPTDFIQVHAGINRKMVPQALAALDLQPGQRVLDLFCGLGNFTLPLARSVTNGEVAGEVVGVEVDDAMLARARANARDQGIANTRYERADLDDVDALKDAGWLGERHDRVLLDPPRTGAAAVIEALAPQRIERMVYVSCNPATLARDAERLVHHHGYRLERAGIMDMFPHTAHVESMAVFRRD
ncbi:MULTISPECIES: 23S rRNA (uracil(1939)-C(5))-methyltransferase RlmD [Thioalkalivibrio]|uniref:23S rRNA (uracil(1939)-C(5))-methyltransferase RlmD n=1 Tax=Thioalkalivibrio TaxID=106633 RepID=UPI000372A0C9|nr:MULTISPECIES: 23S rRNA (uracil(1939)-C(5))-methyltransferase RlmD [Thioalkalivibrio]